MFEVGRDLGDWGKEGNVVWWAQLSEIKEHRTGVRPGQGGAAEER